MKKTNVKKSDLGYRASFPEGNVFDNTDENGNRMICVFSEIDDMWGIPYDGYKIIMAEIDHKEADREEGMVSEDFAIRAMVGLAEALK